MITSNIQIGPRVRGLWALTSILGTRKYFCFFPFFLSLRPLASLAFKKLQDFHGTLLHHCYTLGNENSKEICALAQFFFWNRKRVGEAVRVKKS